ncbi:MAG: FHA domain-containing protein [Acidobacteriota bacterium]
MTARTARLLLREGARDAHRFDFTGEATLGRDPASTVTLESHEVSGRHARIHWDEDLGHYLIDDLDSLNGTELDGEPVRTTMKLDRLHVITLGGAIELIFQGPDLCAPAPPAADHDATTSHSDTLLGVPPMALPGSLGAAPPFRSSSDDTRVDQEAVQVLPTAFGSAPPPAQWRLQVADHGPAEGFPLRPGRNRVGRIPESEVLLDGASISRLHAVLTVHRGRLSVRDAGSRNRTWLGDRAIQGEVEVQPGTELRFGNVTATVIRRAPATDSGESS